MPARAYNKLKSKKIFPVCIIAKINNNVYCLELLANITTSDVFNVRYISQYKPPDMPSDLRSNPTHFGGPDAVAFINIGANMKIIQISFVITYRYLLLSFS